MNYSFMGFPDTALPSKARRGHRFVQPWPVACRATELGARLATLAKRAVMLLNNQPLDNTRRKCKLSLATDARGVSGVAECLAGRCYWDP